MERKNTAEYKRLHEGKDHFVPPWQKWGPYMAERSWGTVREDYSENGDAWNYFPHDQARVKAYRWGEDGIAGWCDRFQILCFAPAFWNGQDAILKERLFGLNAWEGNHGEDVKECYYYIDGTPSHSYMKYLYKYPHKEFPYTQLVEENRKRNSSVSEYELVDTGIFSDNRYFDIFIEYAKASSEDTCIRIEVHNRAEVDAPLHIAPQLWFRNQWSWGEKMHSRPEIRVEHNTEHGIALVASEKDMSPPQNLLYEYKLGKRYFYGPVNGEPLFTHNESPFFENATFVKDAFHRSIINKEDSCNPGLDGTKACLHYSFNVKAKSHIVLHLRLSDKLLEDPLADVDVIVDKRKREADQFYEAIQPESASAEEKKIQRTAIAGALWSKQFYYVDIDTWFRGDRYHTRPAGYKIRNVHWRHLNSMRILCMPDKWEYPWFAAWDHAFHCLTLGLVDIQLAKEQIWLLFFEQFQHPNGQLPAYEWEFSDLNPPVHAWALLRLIQLEEEQEGIIDFDLIEKCYHKLLINFAWWVNKVDSAGFNIFEGGFLGLDNITFIDRSIKLLGGVHLEQSDGTGWMAFFCLNLMRLALLLSKRERIYESLAIKFFQHFVHIAHAMKIRDESRYELWDEQDGFFYDIFRYPNGTFSKCRIRSLVGLIPLLAIDSLTKEEISLYPEFEKYFYWFVKNKNELSSVCVFLIEKKDKECFMLSVLDKNQLKRSLEYVWNPLEFRAQFGLRSLSRYHEANPFIYEDKIVSYEPGEALHKIKGGNSNWRGPIWFPTTYLFVEALLKFAHALEDKFMIQIEGEKEVSLNEIAESFADRMMSLFKKDKNQKMPFLGEDFPFKEDPNWSEWLLFYEYYHPETGKGLGASHQTGWSALVANLIQEFRKKT
ncbi:MAG: hypothetical protein P4L16_05725 [Chlamydiales bacterium]|nr:hypothetical protein [Chlamydiales bacterium]